MRNSKSDNSITFWKTFQCGRAKYLKSIGRGSAGWIKIVLAVNPLTRECLASQLEIIFKNIIKIFFSIQVYEDLNMVLRKKEQTEE